MEKPSIELAMIVRNGAASLARAIHSALPAVDHVMVGDTGSTDNSAAIARGLGAEVFDVPWEEDFAQARNAVLQACTADWILILDADEMLDPQGVSSIPELASQGQVDAWEVWKWNYIRTLTSRSGIESARRNPNLLPESHIYPAYTRSLSTLFFRRIPGLCFEYEVHETVSRRARELQLRIAEAPFVIHHFGYAEESVQQRQEKLERYHQAGIRKVQTHPHDYWAHYELGLSTFEHRRDPQSALLCLENALRLNPHFHPAWIYAGICLARCGHLEQALECLSRGEDPDHPNALLHEAKGDVYFHSGDFPLAEQHYRLAGQLADLSPLTACKLGACAVRMGRREEGLAAICHAVEREPHTAELHDIRIAAAMECGEIQTAAEAALERLKIGFPNVDFFVIAAGLQARLGHWEQAAWILFDGMRLHPAEPRLRREWEIAVDRHTLSEPLIVAR